MSADLFLGLDLGTSGARALVIDAEGQVVASGRSTLSAHAPSPRDPRAWALAAEAAVLQALSQTEASRVRALAVDGTSGTVLAVDARGEPLGEGLMYNDAAEPAGVMAIAETAPDVSAAHGVTSGLAKAMQLRALKPNRVLHQADWIASRFSGRFVTDANNALKTGYDPIAGRWPDWMGDLGFNIGLLPEVFAPGQTVGLVTREAAALFGLDPSTRVVAGTTDGCASFLATGASEVGEAVTAIGTSLTLKLLSDRPIFSPQYGVYSHYLLGMWLAGGASNTGGGVLLPFFTAEEIEAMTPELDPDRPTGLDYYPLSKPGERFPIADPDYPPRLSPRPGTQVQFLQALFEGIAAVEALGYARLAELGAPPLKSVRTVGGGARNPAWTRIRARVIGAPILEPRSDEAAYGAALLAKGGEMIRARSLNELIERYDAFLVDQYGVLLDGAGPYGHARAALAELHARSKRVLLISNSGKRSAANASRLSRFGFSRASYTDIVSSGEVAYNAVARRIGDTLARGARVWVETSDDTAQPLQGLDLTPVRRPEEADLIWIAGCRPMVLSLDDYARALQPAAARGAPAICSNPDQTMLSPSGKVFGAGAVAHAYERLGGTVEWFGKPYPAIYEEALRRLGDVPRARVLAVGDSPAHDILGGARAGLATCLVRTGVHDTESEAELIARCEAAGAMPDFMLPRFAF